MVDQNDDLEFATAEDLEIIAANPALQKAYNAMKAGVTKKFQGWSGERKTLADTLASYEGVLKQWEEWRPILDTYIADGGKGGNGNGDDDVDGNRGDGKRGRRGRQPDDTGTTDTFKSFQEEIRQAATGFQKELQTNRRMVELSLQLDDLRRTHFEKYPKIKFEGERILKLALDKGYSNLVDAYDNAYRDDFIKSDVEAQVSTRLEEEKAKLRVPGETGTGAMPTGFKLPTDTPKTFSAASQGVLDEIKAGTLTKEL